MAKDSLFTSTLIKAFLGISRFKKLEMALRGRYVPHAENSFIIPFIALFLGITPLLVYATFKSSDFMSVVIGIGALLSLLQIIREKTVRNRPNIRQQLSLTHTSFALGCIPAVFVVILFPQGLYAITRKGSAITSDPIIIILTLLLLAVWSGTTEELLYRGLILKHLRRWKMIKKTVLREGFAVLVTALIFGACHIPVWGLPLSMATAGIGVGFGLAYLATNESVWPLAVYHSTFNFLSLLVAWLSFRA